MSHTLFWAVGKFGDSCLGGSMIFSSCLLCKKSMEQMKKVPTIILSVSYKGVKFIDATNKVSSNLLITFFIFTITITNVSDSMYIV